MNYKEVDAAETTITRDLVELDDATGNVYEAIVVVAKRANQIGLKMKEELNSKLAEKDGNFEKARTYDELKNSERFRDQELSKGLHKLKKNNLLRKKGNEWLITRSGFKEAMRIVRLHRLWELYLNQRLNLEPDHVHNDAEAIEHIITPEIEMLLAKELDSPTIDPHASKIPYPTE